MFRKYKVCLKYAVLGSAVAMASAAAVSVNAGSIAQALKTGKAYGNMNLRYEDVSQDNAVRDATAGTLRTRVGYITGDANGFSAQIEFEDSRIVLGQDEFTVGPAGFNPGEFSVIADPETTELDQGFIQYKTGDKSTGVTAKLGRQVFTLDGHRFVGHVGWRQDRQTFDAATVAYKPTKDLKITGAHIYKRNRIFAEAADLDSNDFLLNVSYQTPFGKLVGYSYNLEVDTGTGTDPQRDTIGLSFTGAQKFDAFKLLYAAEFATQEFDPDTAGATKPEADYLKLELGAVVSGWTFKIGQETLGSDDGTYGFTTELATLHKFNGFADVFLGTPTAGLVDTYVVASTKLGPGKITAFFHDFTADEDTPTFDDLGKELDVVYGYKINKIYSGGIKYADYRAKDNGVDTEKLWVWLTAKF